MVRRREIRESRPLDRAAGAASEASAGTAPDRTPSQAVGDLTEALARFGLSDRDTRFARDRLTHVGLPDPSLGEWILVEACSVDDARSRPLKRSRRGDAKPDRAHWITVTLVLPSRRVFQLQRYYMKTADLDAQLKARARPADPALTIRELIVGAPGPGKPTQAFLDALERNTTIEADAEC